MPPLTPKHHQEKLVPKVLDSQRVACFPPAIPGMPGGRKARGTGGLDCKWFTEFRGFRGLEVWFRHFLLVVFILLIAMSMSIEAPGHCQDSGFGVGILPLILAVLSRIVVGEHPKGGV